MEKGPFYITQIAAFFTALFGFSLNQIAVVAGIVVSVAGLFIQYLRYLAVKRSADIDNKLKIKRAEAEGLDVSDLE